LRPLREEWTAVKAKIEPIAEKAASIAPASQSPGDRQAADNAARRTRAPAIALRDKYLDRLASISILDPACGSGNFLYLALQGVKDLENRVMLECEAMGLAPRALSVGPEIVHGIEINPLAAELARTTIWIGDIQWGLRNGIYSRPNPILRKLDSIECRDALVTEDKSMPETQTHYVETQWPKAEFIVGNPPFLGAKWMLENLGEEYTCRLREIFGDRIPNTSDLVTYWLDKARVAITQFSARGAGLVATNMVRGSANRVVMQRIVMDCPIFSAWSDEAWVVEGADVRVSIVCFRKRTPGDVLLNGTPSQEIFADLTSGSNLTIARRLEENLNTAVRGIERGAPFDVSGALARDWLLSPLNPNGQPNSNVLRPFATARGVVGRSPDKWIIDFSGLSDSDAALYERVFEYAKDKIKGSRSGNREKRTIANWWLFRRSGELVRNAIQNLDRYIVTGLVSKYRTFVWLPRGVIPDTRLVVIARSDDTTFGILSSRFHEMWTLNICQYHGVGNDPVYTQGTTFETFPFPVGLTPNISAKDCAHDPRSISIANAAKHLNELRNSWLNPPDLVRIEPEVVAGYPNRILPKDAIAAVALRERTLTNLYNQRPQWLVDAHHNLDVAVASAYGWPVDITEDEALAKLLELNLSRVAAGKAEIDLLNEEADEDSV
jgi:type II restriction/modification system DNA methylase subunit YeeA